MSRSAGYGVRRRATWRQSLHPSPLARPWRRKACVGSVSSSPSVTVTLDRAANGIGRVNA